MGVRQYGSVQLDPVTHVDQARTSAAGDLTDAPQPKLLGTIDPEKLTRHPSFAEDGPPPWEVDPRWIKHNTDARRFVDVPETWELRWLNPRAIDRTGLREWQPVMTSDPRVNLKVPALRSVENYVRRGGQGGDILCFMPKSWVESRNRLKAQLVERRTQASIERQRQTVEEINRGNFGPRIHVDSATHPTHTQATQAEMTDT